MGVETWESSRILRSELLASLPPLWPQDVMPSIQSEVYRHDRKLIVLDDDPTGTQTVYDIPVLTDWSVESLRAELSNSLQGFFILANSRALPESEACRVIREIGQNLHRANQGLHRSFVVISRSDSTLRGHFPAEVEALGAALFNETATASSSAQKPALPPILLIPFFEAGGRYTIRDVHYVADGEWLLPAGETEFARDAVFGYRSSNLREWLAEKSRGRIRADEVFSISIDELRCKGPDEVAWKLLSLEEGSVCIVNAARGRDLEVLALATLRAEKQGGRFLYRTAASFVAARLGLPARSLWNPAAQADAAAGPFARPAKVGTVPGGLFIVGSHVPRTTAQLDELLRTANVVPIPLSSEDLLGDSREVELSRATSLVNTGLREGRDVVVFTTREVVLAEKAEEILDLGQRISDALAQLLRGVEVKPRYVVAKGGITASDLASKGLGIKRAMILGQILPGVPVWELGAETKFPGAPYIVFPGNVGQPSALTQVVSAFRPTPA
jgi:uncharacterized protein YgbK (DUF1537 family)